MGSNTDNTLVSSPAASDAERLSELRSASPFPQDPFDSLPSETLVEIFSYAYPVVNLPMDLPYNRMSRFPGLERLLAVCKRWQAITLSNTSLWATLAIKTRRIEPKDWRWWGLSQLRKCVERSATYPLNICIDSGDTDSGAHSRYMHLFMPDHATIDGILRIIMQQSERWRRIEFDVPMDPRFSRMFGALQGHLPLLEHLDMHLSRNGYPGGQFTGTSFLNAPKLKSLSICPSLGLEGLRKIQINWTQISELTFSTNDSGSKDDFHKMLGWLSGSLRSLIFSGSSNYRLADRVGEQSRTTTLTPLRRLFISNICDILDMLVCPSLKELEINHSTEHEITSFLDRSSCALTSMKLHSLCDSPTYHAILHHASLSTLKYLSLTDITDEDLDILNLDTHYLFPSLETLSLHLSLWRPFFPFPYRDFLSVTSSENLLSDEELYRPQLMAPRIERLRKVVDSRTRRTADLNRPKSFVDGVQSNKVQRESTHSLTNCLFSFDLYIDGPGGYDDWKEDLIYALRSFCISRNIVTSLKISYRFHYSIC